MACFMGLLASLAARPEVLRISPRHKMGMLNAAGRANIQSGNVTYTPLSDAGLDGSGEIIQVTAGCWLLASVCPLGVPVERCLFERSQHEFRLYPSGGILWASPPCHRREE